LSSVAVINKGLETPCEKNCPFPQRTPVRWEHINFIGKYVFLQAKSTINIEDIIAQLQKNLKTTLYT